MTRPRFRKPSVFIMFSLLFSLSLTHCTKHAWMVSKSGLRSRILQKGEGPVAREGQEILLFETTRYRDGTVLYSNENSTTPVKVKLGAQQATQAVDEALHGMKAGEVKEIIATPNLVKRKSYPSNVHRDSTLVIKLILHKIL